MKLQPVLAWLRQPTSVAGLATLVGIGVALALRQVTWLQAAAPAAAALGLVLVPDNTQARADAVKLVTDLSLAAAAGAPGAAAAAPRVVADVAALAADANKAAASTAKP